MRPARPSFTRAISADATSRPTTMSETPTRFAVERNTRSRSPRSFGATPTLSVPVSSFDAISPT